MIESGGDNLLRGFYMISHVKFISHCMFGYRNTRTIYLSICLIHIMSAHLIPCSSHIVHMPLTGGDTCVQ